MIEIISAERCTSCDICVSVRPTNVFDKTHGIPVIARQSDCQTCFLCELYCPEDALYVSPFADETERVDLVAVKEAGVMGSYRRAVGWTDETRDRRNADRSYLLFGHWMTTAIRNATRCKVRNICA